MYMYIYTYTHIYTYVHMYYLLCHKAQKVVMYVNATAQAFPAIIDIMIYY
jgi:hypothetical protein